MFQSINAVVAEDKEAPQTPFLKGNEFWLQDASVLPFFRVQLSRNRPGMSDFLIRIACIGGSMSEAPTVVTVRGTKAYSSPDTVQAFVQTIASEFKSRGNKMYDWDKLDIAYISSMLEKNFKAFISNSSISVLGFDTDALR